MKSEIANCDLTLADVPGPDADWSAIERFALSFNGYAAHGSETCADIANARRHESLTDLRTCLFYEQRRWRHFGDEPDEAGMQYVRKIVEKIRRHVAERDLS